MVSEDGSEASAFDGYVEALIEVIGHADRAEPLRDYCTGLMMPVARKSVEPLAANGAGACFSQTSVTATFCGTSALVG
jgi:SRSO17 transposase